MTLYETNKEHHLKDIPDIELSLLSIEISQIVQMGFHQIGISTHILLCCDIYQNVIQQVDNIFRNSQKWDSSTYDIHIKYENMNR